MLRDVTIDTQLKEGLLEICVLAVLKKEDSYGYRTVEDISPYIKISESTLYPILRRLENSRCLSIYFVEHHGRLRKYYRIADIGIVRIRDFSMEWQSMLHIYEFIKGGDEFE